MRFYLLLIFSMHVLRMCSLNGSALLPLLSSIVCMRMLLEEGFPEVFIEKAFDGKGHPGISPFNTCEPYL
jgi:hypothetical protein